MGRPNLVNGSGTLHSLRVDGEGRQAPFQLVTVPRGEGYIPRVTYVYIEIFLYTLQALDYCYKIIKWVNV